MKPTIIIDTREQAPFLFSENVDTQTAGLDAGDYSVAGLTAGVAIERTSTHLHAAEALLIANLDAHCLPSLLPRATDLATRALRTNSAQRAAVAPLTSARRQVDPLLVALAVESAHASGDGDHDRARSFRNTLLPPPHSPHSR